MRLKPKLLLAFSGLAGLTAIVGVLSWHSDARIEDSFRAIREDQLKQIATAEAIDDNLQKSLASIEIMVRLRTSPAALRIQKSVAVEDTEKAFQAVSQLANQSEQTLREQEAQGQKAAAQAEREELATIRHLANEIHTFQTHTNEFSELLTQHPDEALAFLATVLEIEMNHRILPDVNAYQESQFDELGAEADSVYSRIRLGYGVAVASTALAFMIAVIIGLWMARAIGRSVERLKHAADALGEGRTDVPLDIHTGDEVESLAHSFRRMSEALQKSQLELRAANDSLERRVKMRTTELLQTNDLLKKEIQDRQVAQERMRHLLGQLERSNTELQDFASVASHDLQEPLRKVQVFGERLKAKCGEALSEEGKDFLNRLLNATGRMQGLINDLLAYSRVTTKAQPFVPVVLNKVVREVLSDLEIRLEQVQGNVEVGELPAIEADAMQMRQLFQNLIGNALKFRRPNVAPVIRVAMEPAPAGRCQIAVNDNGIGFEEKYNDRIFKVFERLHGRDAYEGTGMGLAICRKIVERHGGSLTARSTPGQGSTFIMTLPLAHASEKEPAWTPKTSPLSS